MRLHSMKTLMLAVLTVAVLSALPDFVFAQTATSASTGLSAQSSNTRRATTRRHRRRRPVARTPTTPTTPTTIAVPVGTDLKIRLNDTISSKTARVGDQFTATVVDPVKYSEATVKGHVASIFKSGKVNGKTTMNLAFNSISTTDGRTGTLHGYVTRVYGQDSGKADNEGGIESGSRTKQAIKRGGIGAAAGAIIGGIAGGGKGAAIGLIIGGAGGAGSLAVQGAKELKIESGTELLVHVTR
ncbi:MAG TPA: hypothetical protein VN920_01510 [Pyrinomonadaceae bacterium]|nr:hypothetical protein [Pyrinomonadaceae bacterium]